MLNQIDDVQLGLLLSITNNFFQHPEKRFVFRPSSVTHSTKTMLQS